MVDGDVDEEESATPDHGQGAEDQPIAAIHLRPDHVRIIARQRRSGLRLLAVKRLGFDRFHGWPEVGTGGRPRQQMPAAWQ